MNCACARVIEGGDLGDIGAADKGAAAGAAQDREPQLGITASPAMVSTISLISARLRLFSLPAIVDRQPRDVAAFGPLLVFDKQAVRLIGPIGSNGPSRGTRHSASTAASAHCLPD